MNTRLIKCVLFCFVLAFVGRSFGYVTNEWNNATGDCKWSTAGNWSLGVVPNAGDVVACVAQSDDKPINRQADQRRRGGCLHSPLCAYG